ncbi:MAG: ABC transporter permease [Tenericutes bacterium]|nr:ABC transporter permease [Mycoplasmatota bacterium]
MRTILLMVRANIKSKILQSIALAAVFIAVSILFFLSVRLFGTVGAYEDMYIESKTSQCLIYVEGEDSKDIIVNYLENNEEVLNINVLSNFNNIIESNIVQGDELISIPDAMFTEYSTSEFDQIKWVEGKTVNELLDNEVIYSYGKSKLKNISVGDTIVINTEQGTREMIIAGIGIDLTYNFDTITLNRFWTTKSNVESLENGEKEYSIGISYYNYSGESEQVILDEINAVLGDKTANILTVSHELILTANSFFQMIMGSIFTLIGVILIFVGLFIIRSIVFNNIVADSKKIATLKSTGFSSKNIVSIYVLEYGVIAFLSIIIGGLVSLLLSNVVLGDLNELSNLFGSSNSVNIIQMVSVLIVMLLVIEFTVYLAARDVSKINPAVALSRGEQVNETKSTFSLIQHKRLPISLVLAIKDIFYNKKMIITLILFIVATSFTIVTLSSASYSLNTQKDNNELWLGYDIDAKVVSSTPLDLEAHDNMILELEASEYIEGTVTVYLDLNSQIFDDNQEKYLSSISEVFVTENKEPIDFSVLDGRLPDNEDEIMIAHNLLVMLKKEIGDYTTVRSLGEEKELLIVGEYQSMANQGTTFRLFLDEIDDEFLNTSLIKVNFVEGFSEEQMFAEVDNLFGSDVTLVIEYSNASMVSMIDVLGLVTGGVIGIFAVICLVVLLNLNLTNVYKERYNYGIYKSIGMDDKKIINIYLFKNSIINIIGLIIGGAIAILIVPSVMNVITGILGIVEFPTNIDYLSILVSTLIVFAVTFINALIIKRNVSLITPKELLVE